jgi:23S rRNA pseudouridine955/2504/2580 synthase
MRIIKIEKNDAGQRLDKFLTKAVKGLPISLMYKYIRTKKIKVNRARTEQKYVLQEGDIVQLFIKDEFFDSPEKDNSALASITPKLTIVYEDENIMLLNKRPGVLVHEDDSAKENTLVMHIKAYLAQKGEYSPNEEQSFSPALCNRIDRNTGGIVIAAKNAESLRILCDKIKTRELDKRYITVVHGVPQKKEALLKGFLKKNENENKWECNIERNKDVIRIWQR